MKTVENGDCLDGDFLTSYHISYTWKIHQRDTDLSSEMVQEENMSCFLIAACPVFSQRVGIVGFYMAFVEYKTGLARDDTRWILLVLRTVLEA